MSSEEVEIVLCRHWASNLSTPIFLVDANGNLIFYNEAAEPMLGVRFAEVGEMSSEVWSSAFSIKDDSGNLIPAEELPLSIAINQQLPAHRTFKATAYDNVERIIETTCFPLINREGKQLGAVAIFWRLDADDWRDR